MLALAFFPKFSIHRIKTDNPDRIKQFTKHTRLPPTQLSHLSQTYNPPHGAATLYINNELITSNITQHLRNAYSTQQYRTYLQNKYRWSDQTIETIDWQILSRALGRLKGNHKRIIQQFIHQWLPVNAHHGQAKINTARLCPHCRRNDETHEHFLFCPTDSDKWNEDITHILQKTEPQTPKHLYRILHDALQLRTTSTTHDLTTDDTPIDIYTLHLEQQRLGWNQLLCGRWTTQWIKYYEASSNRTDGEKWAATTLFKLWQAVINKWHRRNEAEHNETPLTTNCITQELNSAIQSTYNESINLDHIDRLFFEQPVEEILMLNNKRKKKWITRAQKFLNQGLHRARLRTKMKNRSITEYFHPQKHSNTKGPSPKPNLAQEYTKAADLRPP